MTASSRLQRTHAILYATSQRLWTVYSSVCRQLRQSIVEALWFSQRRHHPLIQGSGSERSSSTSYCAVDHLTALPTQPTHPFRPLYCVRCVATAAPHVDTVRFPGNNVYYVICHRCKHFELKFISSNVIVLYNTEVENPCSGLKSMVVQKSRLGIKLKRDLRNVLQSENPFYS